MPTPRRLVVTGASSGFGHAIAVAAKARGWEVLGTVRKDADAARLETLGVATARMDLALPATIASGCDTILAWSGGTLDAVVHNAGSSWPAPVELMDPADLRLQFEVNFFGHVDVTQRLLGAVRAARGRMVYVSSDSTTITPPFLSAYAASKRALEAMAESLAQEVADQGVVVTIVAPGPYRTAIWDTAVPRGEAYLSGTDPRLGRYRDRAARFTRLALGRPMGPPEDLARVVLDVLDRRHPPFRVVAPLASRAVGGLRHLLGARLFHRVVGAIVDRMER